jgi:prepilin-type N-terminal cleavage/methylation domain-containing protein
MSSVLRRTLRRLGGQAGMTLTEVLVTVAIIGLVVPASITFVFSMQRNERRVSESTEQEHQARLAIETFSRSLREAGYAEGFSYDSSSIFYSASPNQVSFYSDPNGDGIEERVTYRLDTTARVVQRDLVVPNCTVTPCSYISGATTTTRPILDDVRNADMAACGSPTPVNLFHYYSVDRGTGVHTEITGSATDQLVDIAFVQMTVVTDITPNQSPTCHTLSTGVTLRNWRG